MAIRNESDFKRVFKASVRAQKGYTISLAAPVFPGIPDLYTIMPRYMPVLIEAKWVTKITNLTFKRKIRYSPNQIEYAKKVNAVQPQAMMGLIGVIYNSNTYAILKPILVDEDNVITDDFIRTDNWVGLSTTKTFDVATLFERSAIPILPEEKSNEGHLGDTGPTPDNNGAPLLSELAVPGQTT